MITNGTLIATFLAALWTATPLAAQTSDPADIPRRLNTGDIIAIIAADGSETRGQLERVDSNGLEIRPITAGAAANEYRMSATRKTIPIQDIAALNRVDAFGKNPEAIFLRQGSFGTLPSHVKAGQMVQVTERSGARFLGRVTDVSSSTLVIDVRRDNPRDGSGRPRHDWSLSRTFTPAAVARIEQPAHLWDGALKGMGVALAIIGITAASTCGGSCYSEAVVFTLALGAGIGAGAGIAIDAAFPPKRLYRAPR